MPSCTCDPPPPCLQVFTNFQEVCLHVEESQIEEVFRIMKRVNGEAQAELLQMLRALTSTKVRVSVCVCVCVCVRLCVTSITACTYIHNVHTYACHNTYLHWQFEVCW